MGVREERAAQPKDSTPGWVHQCTAVKHEVWTVRHQPCAFCGMTAK